MVDDRQRFRRPAGMGCGIAVILGLIVLIPWPIQSAERPHVSLIDPETTNCVLCHEALSSNAHEDVPPRGCLECHTFGKKGDATLVVVDRVLGAAVPADDDSRDPRSAPGARDTDLTGSVGGPFCERLNEQRARRRDTVGVHDSLRCGRHLFDRERAPDARSMDESPLDWFGGLSTG